MGNQRFPLSRWAGWRPGAPSMVEARRSGAAISRGHVHRSKGAAGFGIEIGQGPSNLRRLAALVRTVMQARPRRWAKSLPASRNLAAATAITRRQWASVCDLALRLDFCAWLIVEPVVCWRSVFHSNRTWQLCCQGGGPWLTQIQPKQLLAKRQLLVVTAPQQQGTSAEAGDAGKGASSAVAAKDDGRCNRVLDGQSGQNAGTKASSGCGARVFTLRTVTTCLSRRQSGRQPNRHP